ncbi:hypothetical protein ES703_01563 [subsurface metagenome]
MKKMKNVDNVSISKNRISSNIVKLGFVSFFTDTSTDMIYPLLPLFLRQLGAGSILIGLIEGLAESSSSIFKVFSGWLSDRIRKRKILVVIGYSISSVIKPLFGFSRNVIDVLFLRFTERIGKGIRTAPRDAIIAESSLKESRGRAFGFHRGMDTLGAVAGPILAFLLLPLFKYNYRAIFFISVIPAAIAVLLIFFVKEGKKIKEKTTRELSFSGYGKTFIFFIIIIGFFSLANSSNAFLILRAQDVGVKPLFIPLLWGFFNIVYALVSFPGGILSDKIGRKAVIITGMILYALVYFGFATVLLPSHVWFLFFFYGVYYGITECNLRAFIVDLSPEEKKATAIGIYHTTVGVIVFPASLLMGILWRYINPAFAFGFCGTIAFISAFLLFFVKGER